MSRMHVHDVSGLTFWGVVLRSVSTVVRNRDSCCQYIVTSFGLSKKCFILYHTLLWNLDNGDLIGCLSFAGRVEWKSSWPPRAFECVKTIRNWKIWTVGEPWWLCKGYAIMIYKEGFWKHQNTLCVEVQKGIVIPCTGGWRQNNASQNNSSQYMYILYHEKILGSILSHKIAAWIVIFIRQTCCWPIVS